MSRSAGAGLILALALGLGGATAAQPTPESTVRRFIEAYNDRDFTTLERLLHADAAWMAVEGDKLSTEGKGRDALMKWMRNYLGKTCPTCRSDLLSVGASGRFVSTIERARWMRRDGRPARQSGVGVYEVEGGAIRAVWYFPATPE